MNFKITPRQFSFFSFILILISVSSCSVKKRSYRKGYHIDWVFSKKKISADKLSPNTKHDAVTGQHADRSSSDIVTAPQQAIASAKTSSEFSVEKHVSILDENCGDIITLKKGDQIKAKVLEVGVSEIKYRRCDNLDGPLIIISKSSVYSIKYLNGHEDHFFDTPQPKNKKPETPQNEGQKELHPLAVAALVCTILITFLWPLAALLGAILGGVAMGQIREKPDQYRGYVMAKVSMIVSIVALVLFVLLIIALLSLI